MDTRNNNTPKIMENKIAAFTFFTFLLFIVSAARLTVVPPSTNPSAVQSEDVSKTSHQSAAATDSNILLPGEKAKPDSDETAANNHLPKLEKTTYDLTPHANFSRFHPINRHFQGKVLPRGTKQIGKPRRTCRHPVPLHKIPRTEIYDKTGDVSSDRSDNLKPKASRGEIQSNWLKIKQYHYGLRRHHNNHRDYNDNVINTKQVFDREKLKSSVRQQKQKKREEEAGFMKSIRKFLKHTFD